MLTHDTFAPRIISRSIAAFTLSAAATCFAATPPSTQPDSVAFAASSPSRIWNQLIGDPAVFRDPVKARALHDQLVAVGGQVLQQRLETTETHVQPYLMAAGDQNVIDANKALAASPNPRVAQVGKLRLLMSQWLTAPDEAAQIAVADSFADLFKTVQNDFDFDLELYGLHELRPISPAVEDHLANAAIQNLPAYTQLVKAMQSKTLWGSHKGKAIVLSGTTIDGKSFSTANWKGKIILVDFWASWCGPCKDELPHVVAAYKKYHDQGLEVVAVSNDMKATDLKNYLIANPQLCWPQLFDQTAADAREWHSISQAYGVNSIPRMLLIDRNGICRTVDARENMDQMIPALLAENSAAMSFAK